VAVRRIFIAIDISEQARKAAAEHIEYLRNADRDVRVGWEKAEKLHITLKFLGDVDEPRIATLGVAIQQIASRFHPFKLELSDTGVFPNARQPRILWLGIVNTDDQLKTLAASIESACEKLGFAAEDRQFKPHLTIARVREPQKGRQLAAMHLNSDFGSVGFTVRKIVIYESKLGPAGSVYTPISTHRLNAD